MLAEGRAIMNLNHEPELGDPLARKRALSAPVVTPYCQCSERGMTRWALRDYSFSLMIHWSLIVHDH